MRLATTPVRSTDWVELEGESAQVLKRRLDSGSDRPIAVAFSGGGDSLALLHLANHWAHQVGRPLLALTIDHKLSPKSADWARACAARANELGIGHRILSWDGPKPERGVAAAARLARHNLLAEAARETGATVLLMGHTADDRLEAHLMREAGSNVTAPREWSPSPVWPEGRGIFVLRPLIEVRRETIRRALRERGESWLDDPANTDPDSLRARIRLRIAGGGDPGPAREPPRVEALLAAANIDWAGEIALSLEALKAAVPASRDRFIGAALLCAAGTASPPRRVSVDLLWDRLRGGSSVAATLAGARIESDGRTVSFMRDGGAIGAPRVETGVGSVVFDGRFEIAGLPDGAALAALRGYMARLGRSERENVKALRPAARRALPVLFAADGSAACPPMRSLVADRLAAALGGVDREATIGRVGEIAAGVLNRSASLERSVHEPA